MRAKLLCTFTALSALSLIPLALSRGALAQTGTTGWGLTFRLDGINSRITGANISYDGKTRFIETADDLTPDEKILFPQVYEKLAHPEEVYARSEKNAALTVSLLRKHAPFAAWVYDQGEPAYFQFFIGDGTEDTPPLSRIESAVHEVSHTAKGEDPKSPQPFPLLDLSLLPVPKIKGPARSIVFDALPTEEQNGIYASGYLSGDMGESGLRALLSEVNAFSIGNAAAIELGPVLKETYRFNPGLLHTLDFTAIYLNEVKTKYPDVFTAYQNNFELQEILLTLWRQAESVIAQGCESANVILSEEDARIPYRHTAALNELFGGGETFAPLSECSGAKGEALVKIRINRGRKASTAPAEPGYIIDHSNPEQPDTVRLDAQTFQKFLTLAKDPEAKTDPDKIAELKRLLEKRLP